MNPTGHKPAGRAWQGLGLVAMAGGGIVFGAIGLYAFFNNTTQTEEDKKPAFNLYTPIDHPHKPDVGYARKPDPEPVTPPLPVVQDDLRTASAPAPSPLPQRTFNYNSTPPVHKEPKPLQSGFVGQMAPMIDNGGGAQSGQTAMGIPSGEYRPGMADNKNEAWLASAGTDGRDYVTQPFMPPISQFIIQSGIRITARMQVPLNSDLPGDAVALIQQRVCDTPTGKATLIPAGTTMYGRYNPNLEYGQTRAQIAWNRFHFPDGSIQNIGSMNGVDDTGQSGVTGTVDHHIPGLAGAIGVSALSSLIGQAGQFVQNGQSGNTTIGVVGAGALGRPTADIGNEIAQKEINRRNTIEVCKTQDDPTCNVSVMVSKDIPLPQYHGYGCN